MRNSNLGRAVPLAGKKKLIMQSLLNSDDMILKAVPLKLCSVPYKKTYSKAKLFTDDVSKTFQFTLQLARVD